LGGRQERPDQKKRKVEDWSKKKNKKNTDSTRRRSKRERGALRVPENDRLKALEQKRGAREKQVRENQKTKGERQDWGLPGSSEHPKCPRDTRGKKKDPGKRKGLAEAPEQVDGPTQKTKATATLHACKVRRPRFPKRGR